MSTIRWKGYNGTVANPSGGTLNDPNCWDAGVVPGPDDDAILPASSAAHGYTVVDIASIALSSLAIESGATLQIASAVGFRAAKTMTLTAGGSNSGTISIGRYHTLGGHSTTGATFLNTGSINTSSNIAFDALVNQGSIVVAAPFRGHALSIMNATNSEEGTIGLNDYGGKLLLAGSLTNRGTVNSNNGTIVVGSLTSNVQWSSATAGVLTGGKWDSSSGGLIEFQAHRGAGIAEIGSGTTVDYGGFFGTVGPGRKTIDVTQSLTAIDADGALIVEHESSFVNTIDLKGTLSVRSSFASGLITVGQGGAITGSGSVSSDVVSSGSITVAKEGTLSFSGNDTFDSVFSGSGSIVLSAGSDRLNAGTRFSTSKLRFDNADVTLGANLSLARTFEMSGGSLDLAGHMLRLKQTGTAQLTQGYVFGAGNLVFAGATTLGDIDLLGSVATTNTGALIANQSLTLGATNTFINASGASFTLAESASILAASTAVGSFVNQGSLIKAADPFVDTIAVDLINNGTVTLEGGTLDLTGEVSGAGTMTIQNDAILEIADLVARTQTVSFEAGDAGILLIDRLANFQGTVAEFTAGHTIDLSHFTRSGAILTVTNDTQADTSTLKLAHGADQVTLTFDGQFVASGFKLTKDYAGTGTAITYTPPSAAVASFAATHS